MLKNATILAVDDEPINLLILEDVIAPHCKHLILERDAHAVLELARQKQPDIILLDIVMAGMDGYELCARLKKEAKTRHIPIIFLSALGKAADKVKGFATGGVDYIPKPFDAEEVIARLENCLRLHAQIHQNRPKSAQIHEEKILFYQLTNREIEILRLYALGVKRHEIAQRLFMGDSTIKCYLQRLYAKLKIADRAQAIEKACEIGLMNFDISAM